MATCCKTKAPSAASLRMSLALHAQNQTAAGRAAAQRAAKVAHQHKLARDQAKKATAALAAKKAKRMPPAPRGQVTIGGGLVPPKIKVRPVKAPSKAVPSCPCGK